MHFDELFEIENTLRTHKSASHGISSEAGALFLSILCFYPISLRG